MQRCVVNCYSLSASTRLASTLPTAKYVSSPPLALLTPAKMDPCGAAPWFDAALDGVEVADFGRVGADVLPYTSSIVGCLSRSAAMRNIQFSAYTPGHDGDYKHATMDTNRIKVSRKSANTPARISSSLPSTYPSPSAIHQIAASSPACRGVGAEAGE